MNNTSKKQTAHKDRQLHIAGFFAAGVIYMLLSVYLYMPYLREFRRFEYLLLVNSAVGALGCYVLSQRWINSFTGSVLAGAIYGFCPFSLTFAAFHPLAGVPMAIFSWLFIPAAFWRKIIKLPPGEQILSTALSVLLAAAPFGIITLYFWLLAGPEIGPFFPIPRNETMPAAGLGGLISALGDSSSFFIFSIYHIPLFGLVMGLFLYVASGRVGVFFLAAVGLCLPFYRPVAETPPIIWGLVPMLFFSVLCGYGLEGIVLSGKSDRKWLAGCFAIPAVIAAIAFITGSTYSGSMIAAGALIVLCVFLTAGADARWYPYRRMLIAAGVSLDIISGAGYILEKLLGIAF